MLKYIDLHEHKSGETDIKILMVLFPKLWYEVPVCFSFDLERFSTMRMYEF